MTTPRFGAFLGASLTLCASTLCFVSVNSAHAAPVATAHRAGGCGQRPPAEPGSTVEGTLTSGGIERHYRLHVPENYQPDESSPLVLAYHGRGGNSAELEAYSKLSTLSAIVAYPDGVVGQEDQQSWQGAPYSAEGVDDVAFTNDLIDLVEAQMCVDEQRVYATGKSNGGGFTNLLACEDAERIAAIAPVAAALYPTGRECRPSRLVPILEFHGTGDTTIPYDGDEDRGLPALPDWVADRARDHDCQGDPEIERVEPDITISRWGHCEQDAQVHHVAVDGGGHTWPGADVHSGGGHTTHTIQAHEMLRDFFDEHELPASARHA